MPRSRDGRISSNRGTQRSRKRADFETHKQVARKPAGTLISATALGLGFPLANGKKSWRGPARPKWFMRCSYDIPSRAAETEHNWNLSIWKPTPARFLGEANSVPCPPTPLHVFVLKRMRS